MLKVLVDLPRTGLEFFPPIEAYHKDRPVAEQHMPGGLIVEERTPETLISFCFVNPAIAPLKANAVEEIIPPVAVPAKATSTWAEKDVQRAPEKEEAEPIEQVPARPTLKTLFGENGGLAWGVSDVHGIPVGRFIITKVLSTTGNHGLVTSCEDKDRQSYAMKIERGKNEMSTDTLSYTEIHKRLTERGGDLCIPGLIESFKEEGREILVMQRLGPDLKSLQKSLNTQKLSRKTILEIGMSLITAYEQIHEAGWLHLTTKPANFCIGGTKETRHKVYPIEFGRAQQYLLTGEDGEVKHRDGNPYIKGRQAEKYCPYWSSRKITASRRDDMNALAQMLFFWGMTDEARQEHFCDCCPKWPQLFEVLNKGQPKVLTPVDKMLRYTLELKYNQKPDYEMLRESFRSYAKKERIILDGRYDWEDKLRYDHHGQVSVTGGEPVYDRVVVHS